LNICFIIFFFLQGDLHFSLFFIILLIDLIFFFFSLKLGGPDASVIVHNVTVTPFPPVIGQPVHVYIDADLTKQVAEGSTADVRVRYGVITIIDDTFDICSLAPVCPVDPQKVHVDVTVDVPSIIPGGRYRIEVQAQDQDGQEIICVDIDAELRRP